MLETCVLCDTGGKGELDKRKCPKKSELIRILFLFEICINCSSTTDRGLYKYPLV